MERDDRCPIRALNDVLKATGAPGSLEAPITDYPDFERLEFKGQRNVGPFLEAMKQLAEQQRGEMI